MAKHEWCTQAIDGIERGLARAMGLESRVRELEQKMKKVEEENEGLRELVPEAFCAGCDLPPVYHGCQGTKANRQGCDEWLQSDIRKALEER